MKRPLSEKKRRQRVIVEILRGEKAGTQKDIISLLKEKGVATSQSTLSNDLREIGAIKVSTRDGKFRYHLPDEGPSLPRVERMLEQEMRDFLISYEMTGNLVVLKTTSGNAQGLAAALDKVKWEDVLGTVAGDDTILVISRTTADARKALGKIKEILRS